MNLSRHSTSSGTKPLRLHRAPVGLCLEVLRAHLYPEQGYEPGSYDPGNGIGPSFSFIVAAMEVWPKLLTELQRDFGQSPRTVTGEPQESYIPLGYAACQDWGLPKTSAPSDSQASLRESLVAHWPDWFHESVNFVETISYFTGEVEETLEEPTRDLLDHVLFSIYRDEESPWRRTPVIKHLAASPQSRPASLVRRVAAAFDYCTDEFDCFLDWANGYRPGRLPQWPEGNWLPCACGRWACRRLGAADPDAHLTYMTEVLPARYPWYITAGPLAG